MATKPEWRASVGLFLVALVATPLVITGIFRMVPAIPTALPFVIALALAVALWVVKPQARLISLAVAVAVVAHAAFLLYLFSTSSPTDTRGRITAPRVSRS